MKRVALLGMPNTGKSTFFNRLTGASARVGNWPGITVELLGAKILLGADMVEVIDLPGIYDLHGFSEDEQVVRRFLENNTVDLTIIILNAAQIDRQLGLALQLKELGLPAVLLLNMADEAKNLGIRIDTERLEKLCGLPVLLLSAKYGHDFQRARDAVTASLASSRPLPPEEVMGKFKPDERIDALCEEAMKSAVMIPEQFPDGLTAKLDRIFLHPWLGLPLFFGVLYLLFVFVFNFGAPLQDGMAWLFSGFRELALEPLLAPLPEWPRGFLLDGVYDGFATVASFVPLIVLFFLMMAIIEDTGYLSRAAFLMDAFMARLGLDGRGFVMMLMGFGCNVPALMATRIMRSRTSRLLAMLIIPFSLCSARLQVFVFITAALFSPHAAPLVLFSLYILSFAAAFLTALLAKRRFPSGETLVLELPPYRFPTARQLVLHAWHEVRHFLRRASVYIISGVALVWLLTHLPPGAHPASPETLAGWIGHVMEPVLSPIGVDQQLAVALIFGFVAKEIVVGSLAVIYNAEGSALGHTLAANLDWVQAYSFMLFTLLYVPCLSTLATLRTESGSLGYTLKSIAWSLGLAWAASFAFYQIARLLGF